VSEASFSTSPQKGKVSRAPIEELGMGNRREKKLDYDVLGLGQKGAGRKIPPAYKTKNGTLRSSS